MEIIETRDIVRNGVTYRLTLTPDYHMDVDQDGDWATDADKVAYLRDHWQYVDLTITPVFEGIEITTASRATGGVVYGSLSTSEIGMDEIITGVFPDYISEVNDLLADVLPDLIAALQAFKP